MNRILWVLPILGSIAGLVVAFMTFTSSTSAPQEAAGFAMACALAVVPYVLARSVMAMCDSGESGSLDRIASILERQSRQANSERG